VRTDDDNFEEATLEHDFSVITTLPDGRTSVIRLPFVAHWAHFKAIIGHYAEGREWCAGFEEKLWNRHERVSTDGRTVEIIWVSSSGESLSEMKRIYSRPKTVTQEQPKLEGTLIPSQEEKEVRSCRVTWPGMNAGKKVETGNPLRFFQNDGGGNGAPRVNTKCHKSAIPVHTGIPGSASKVRR
jgi:hypothetical protein